MLYKELSAIKAPTISGRHSDEEKTKWFELPCDRLDSAAGAEMCTLKDLHNKMAEISGRSEIYSMIRMKQKQLEHYDDSTFFAEVGGCDNVVCFRNVDYKIDKKDSIEDEAERIVVASDTLLKANIGEQEYDTELYPCDIDIVDFDNGKLWIPHLLQKLQDITIPSSVKADQH